jgi:hypothetical protein
MDNRDEQHKPEDDWTEMFELSRKEIWKGLSLELNAKFVDGGLWAKDKIQFDCNPWTITLDTYSVGVHGRRWFTRIRAPYRNPSGFRFRIGRRGFFSNVAIKFFGMQSVNVHQGQFDNEFVLQGNSAYRVRELFASEKIRQIISAQPVIEFDVKDDEGMFCAKFPPGVDELCCVLRGEITDVGRIKLLLELFAETLAQLYRIGAALKENAGVNL